MPGRFAFSPPRHASGRAGVSLVEIVFALSILATVLVALGGLMFQVARHTRQSAAVGYRSAAAATAAARLQLLPFDSLDAAVGCSSDSTGLLAYSRCTSVQDVTSRRKRVSVVISPTGALVVPPETVVVERHRPISPSTLNIR